MEVWPNEMRPGDDLADWNLGCILWSDVRGMRRDSIPKDQYFHPIPSYPTLNTTLDRDRA